MIFYYHFNKPLSKKAGKPQISLHYKKTCHIVDNIICNVATFGKINNRQPYFVVKGKAKDIEIQHGIAYIN